MEIGFRLHKLRPKNVLLLLCAIAFSSGNVYLIFWKFIPEFYPDPGLKATLLCWLLKFFTSMFYLCFALVTVSNPGYLSQNYKFSQYEGKDLETELRALN